MVNFGVFQAESQTVAYGFVLDAHVASRPTLHLIITELCQLQCEIVGLGWVCI